MEYVQKRYKYADVPFPERSSRTININQEMINTSSNMNTNININETSVKKNTNILNCNCKIECGQDEACLCPGCGRMTLNQSQLRNVQTESQSSQNIEMVNQSENVVGN